MKERCLEGDGFGFEAGSVWVEETFDLAWLATLNSDIVFSLSLNQPCPSHEVLEFGLDNVDRPSKPNGTPQDRHVSPFDPVTCGIQKFPVVRPQCTHIQQTDRCHSGKEAVVRRGVAAHALRIMRAAGCCMLCMQVGEVRGGWVGLVGRPTFHSQPPPLTPLAGLQEPRCFEMLGAALRGCGPETDLSTRDGWAWGQIDALGVEATECKSTLSFGLLETVCVKVMGAEIGIKNDAVGSGSGCLTKRFVGLWGDRGGRGSVAMARIGFNPRDGGGMGRMAVHCL